MMYIQVKKNNNKVDIIETETQYVIYRDLDLEDARKKRRHLNLGGGFCGSTPAFFLQNITI